MEFFKIALTGGPGAGKTTALCKIEEYFTAMGYKVFLLGETASELLSWGHVKDNCESAYEYQKKIFAMQIAKEDACGEDALSCGAEKILIVCDRGLADNAAYLTSSDYYRLLYLNGTSKTEVLVRYDAVFQLSSTSKYSPSLYKEATKNATRAENYSEAAQLDDALLFAWNKHPHFYYIEPTEKFEDKIDALLHRITEYLGEKPLQKCDKYVINIPDMNEFEATKTHIDMYRPDDNTSVYAVKEGKKYIYVSGKSEQYIDEKHFAYFVFNEKVFNRKISFTRYTFVRKNAYMYIDIYDDLSDHAMLYVLRRDENEAEIPDGIEIVKKITNN